MASGGHIFVLISIFELSPSTPPNHRCSDHLPSLAEAAAGPEDVVLVLVAAPVLVGGGSAPSAVLCEGGGGIDLPDEKKEGSSKDVSCFFRRMGSLDRSALFMKGLHCSAGSFRFISLPIQGQTQREQIILPFIRRGKSEALLIGHLPVSVLRTHLLPGLLDP